MATNSSESLKFQPLEGAIAIIGGGVAGIVAAQKLAEVHEAPVSSGRNWWGIGWYLGDICVVEPFVSNYVASIFFLPVYIYIYRYFLLHLTDMLYFYFELPVFNRFCDKIELDEADELSSLCHVGVPRNENI